MSARTRGTDHDRGASAYRCGRSADPGGPAERACQLQAAHLGNREAAIATVFGGMGCQPPYTGDLTRAAEMVVADEARYLSSADLYVLTPQMCDVVVAAASY